MLEALGNRDYFRLEPPKSLDRSGLGSSEVEELSLEMGAATLTAATVSAIVAAGRFAMERPRKWIVCGGGRRNRTMMAMLAASLPGDIVGLAEEFGFDGSSMEAEAWAYLAVRSLRGLPITFPMTTGAPRPMTGGVLARGR